MLKINYYDRIISNQGADIMYEISKGFKEKYILASHFYKQNGHLRIPIDYVVEVNGEKILLGTWIHNLRQAKAENNDWKISTIEEKFMNKIGMEWDVYYSDFIKNYNKILHNSVGSKIRNILEDENLKQWIHNINLQYKIGRLNGKRKELYECNLNLFSITYLKWQYNYYLAKCFYKQYGHINIPREYISCGYNLGYWIQYQRTMFDKGLLNEDEITKLNEIDMIWCLSEYNFINNKIDKYNKKKYYQKLKDRLIKFIDMYEDEKFENIKQVKVLNNNFKNYLDYTKK